MHAAGMTWLALNLGDGHTWDDWRVVVTRARARAVQVIPWARCRTLAELEALLTEADLRGFRAIANIEDEFERDGDHGPAPMPPAKVREVIDDYPDLAVSFSTGGWLMNDVDYAPIAHRPVLLQVFAQDLKRPPAELPKVTADCIAHAHDKGFKHVGVTCQAYGEEGVGYGRAEAEWYSFLGLKPRSIYTGDDVGAGNWPSWQASA
jgi:hypothetical protein